MRNSDYFNASHLPNAIWSHLRHASSPGQPGLTPELTFFGLEAAPETSWSPLQLDFSYEPVSPISLLSSKLYYITSYFIIWHYIISYLSFCSSCLYFLSSLSFCLSFFFFFPNPFYDGRVTDKKSRGFSFLYYFFCGTCLPHRPFVYSCRLEIGSLQAISWVLLLYLCQESKAKLCLWK